MTLRKATYPIRFVARVIVAGAVIVAALIVLGVLMAAEWLLEDPRPAGS